MGACNSKGAPVAIQENSKPKDAPPVAEEIKQKSAQRRPSVDKNSNSIDRAKERRASFDKQKRKSFDAAEGGHSHRKHTGDYVAEIVHGVADVLTDAISKKEDKESPRDNSTSRKAEKEAVKDDSASKKHSSGRRRSFDKVKRRSFDGEPTLLKTLLPSKKKDTSVDHAPTNE